MSFAYLAGVTTPGAPDEVVDWFTRFETWMIGPVGWTVANGAGTQDIVFQSIGEAGGLTMLFLRVWRDGGNPNLIYFRVQDDLAGTHFTTPPAGGYVDTGGVAFSFWVCGDMDAIVTCFKLGAGYRTVYAGMIEPFALTVPDETYRMIVGTGIANATILRNHTGIWDVDSTLQDNEYMDDARIDRYDGSFTLCGTYFGTGVDIAGQLKHVSGLIEEPAISAEDTIATGRTGATSAWIVVEDLAGNRFAMRTGGVLPTGLPDGAFASVSGVAANWPALFSAIETHLLGRGWVSLGDPGIFSFSNLFYSTGESGEENIYILYAVQNAVVDEFYMYCWDDAVGTNRTGNCLTHLDGAEFPVNYWIVGDRDCVAIVVQRATGYIVLWGGLVSAFPPGLVAPYAGPSLSEYSMVAYRQGDGVGNPQILRDHNAAWTQAVFVYWEASGSLNSNPNAFDGVTYLIWPYVAYSTIPVLNYEPVGQLKYLLHSSGGGIANMDTITVAGQVYTVFFDNAGIVFCVRTT